jgi:hypothetical protein
MAHMDLSSINEVMIITIAHIFLTSCAFEPLKVFAVVIDYLPGRVETRWHVTNS